MNHTERMRGIAKAIVSMLALAWGMGTAIAQVQPAVADNNQDEQINLSRELGDEGTVKILRSGDKSETNEYVTRVYRLEHANPFEVLPYLRTLVTPEKGRVATAFNPDPETGQMRAWVQVSVPSFLVTSVDAAVASYDVAGFKSSPGDVRISYRTQHRSAQEVADFIRQADLSGDGSITADPNTNSLYLVDSPSDFARVISTIQFFDVQIPEVDVELQLVELTEVDQTVLGLDWDAWKLSVGGRYEETAQWSRTHPDGEEVQRSNSQSISWLGAMGATAMADFLNYMIDRGKARMVANTHLVVLNGETGRFSSLTEVPEYNYNYDAAQDLSELDEELDSPANPKYEGLQLRIRPGIAMGCTRLDLTIDTAQPGGGRQDRQSDLLRAARRDQPDLQRRRALQDRRPEARRGGDRDQTHPAVGVDPRAAVAVHGANRRGARDRTLSVRPTHVVCSRAERGEGDGGLRGPPGVPLHGGGHPEQEPKHRRQRSRPAGA